MSAIGKWNKMVIRIVLAGIFLTVPMLLKAPTAVFADDSYEYSPQRQKYVIAPGSLYMNEDFYNLYVKTDAYWAFNSIAYVSGYEGDPSVPHINYNTEKVGYNGEFTKYLPQWDTVLDYLRAKGDLLINYRVSLANNGYYRQWSGLWDNSYNYIWYQTDSNFREYGDMNYIPQKFSTVNIYYGTTTEGVSADKESSRLPKKGGGVLQIYSSCYFASISIMAIKIQAFKKNLYTFRSSEG